MKKAVNLVSKIEALKAELAQAKASEKQHARRAAQRAITRAMHKSGLLNLVIAGALTPEGLAQEFALLAHRATARIPNETFGTNTGKASSSSGNTNQPVNAKSGFSEKR